MCGCGMWDVNVCVSKWVEEDGVVVVGGDGGMKGRVTAAMKIMKV